MNMKWYSKEIKENYELVMKILSKMILSKYPDAKYVRVGPESYNDLFNPDRDKYETPRLDIVVCIDFLNSENYKRNIKIGVEIFDTLNLILKSVIIDDSIFKLHKRIYIGKFDVNTKEYCRAFFPNI
jgi:hypothetical protein